MPPFPVDDPGEQPLHWRPVGFPLPPIRRRVAAIPDTPPALRKGKRRMLVQGLLGGAGVGLGAVAALWRSSADGSITPRRNARRWSSATADTKTCHCCPTRQRDAAMVSAALETHGFRVSFFDSTSKAAVSASALFLAMKLPLHFLYPSAVLPGFHRTGRPQLAEAGDRIPLPGIQSAGISPCSRHQALRVASSITAVTITA